VATSRGSSTTRAGPIAIARSVGRDIWIRAGRNIEPGEELTYDYHTDGEQVIQCKCRPGCTRKL
jgi:SET domain-containing protein